MKRRDVVWMVVMMVAFLAFAGVSWAGPKGILDVWYMQPIPSHQKDLDSKIAEYKKMNPEAEIKLQILGFGTFLQKVVASKASGNPPDIAYTIPDQMWVFQQNGWLDPVDEVIQKLGADKFFEPVPGYAKLDGHHWGVPISMSTHNLQYRKDLLDKKGLKEPRTWDDLLKTAKALTEDTDGDGKIDRYGIAMPLKNEYSTGVHFLGFLWGNGGHVLDKNGNVVFNSPETVQTLRFLKELYKYCPPGVTGYSWMELASTYASDKVAITTYSNLKPLADAIGANEYIAVNTGVCAIPTRLPNQAPKARCAPMKWIMFKGCKNPELARDFLTFWFEPERLIQWYHAEPVFLAPAEKPVIESKAYWENPLIKKYKNAMEKLIALNETAVDPNMEHPGILQPNTGIITQRLIITECLQEVVLEKASPEEAAARAHKRMEEFISKPK